MVAKKQVRQFVRRLAREFSPERVILFGSAEPESSPSSFLSSTAAGGVFVMNEKLRSW